MKGLLIKDLRLILKQKTVLMLVFIIGILNIGEADAAFMAGYMIFIGTFLAINTISYDGFDNGMAYLMTMPSGRKTYAVEKYVFTIGMSVTISLVAFVFAAIAEVINNGGSNLPETVAIVLTVFATALIAACIMIPVNLKFGPEKGRILLFAIVGILVAVGYLLEKQMAFVAAKLAGVIEVLSGMSELVLGLGLLVIVVLVVLVSVAVTVKVMMNKEF